MARSLLDTIINMNRLHLGADAVTVYEGLEDAGLTAAAINITCYRGRTPHLPTLPGLTFPAYGPKRFFFYNLFESDPTGAPLAVFGRSHGSIDGYAAAVGRWLITRDGFDFLVYYLPDYDFASHAHGPDEAFEALTRSDAAIGALLDAAGGPDEFLERYAVVLCSDHGQTHVDRHVRLETPFADLDDVLVTASNRAGMIYRLGEGAPDARSLAKRLDGEESAETVLFLEGTDAIARRDGEELRFAPHADGWICTGDEGLLGYPGGFERAWAALNNPNAGEVIVSATPGFEFADLAGRHHSGGGSHGSLRRGDSEVPMLTIGIDAQPQSIVEVAPAVLQHFGVAPPAYARSAHACRLSPTQRPGAEWSMRSCVGRDVGDERVLAAMERVPRELFVPEKLRDRAYDDAALPIGAGQTISQPYMVARICEALSLTGPEHVLDVGTGSGYQAAVLAELAEEVDTIERIPQLAERARANLAAAGYARVSVHVGDGSRGLPERSPFDAIAVAAAAPELPRTLYDQLEPRGRLVVPVGRRGMQRLEVIVRSPEGPAVLRSVPCRFVPLLGEEGF